MTKIIDIHSHIGDNLHPNGGNIIDKTGIRRKKLLIDPISSFELFNYHSLGVGANTFKFFGKFMINAQAVRNASATLENTGRSLDKAGVDYTVCLPTSTHYVSFDEIKAASEKDKRIIPFTGVDHTKSYDYSKTFAKDVANGAKGLKLHPILQRTSLADKKTFEIVEVFASYNLPVLFHCGVSSYYWGQEKEMEQPELGNIIYAQKLVEAFPKVRFIAGHAGLFQVNDCIELLSGFKNVWVDTSFHNSSTIRRLIKAFGAEKVMFASDWPFGNRRTSIKTTRKACRQDKGLERRIFYENAAELLATA